MFESLNNCLKARNSILEVTSIGLKDGWFGAKPIYRGSIVHNHMDQTAIDKTLFFQGKSFEAVKACVEIGSEFPKMMAGAPLDQEKFIRFYTEMAKDVQVQMCRIGGTFAVAHAIPNKKFRNVIRDILGDQVIFVSLVLSRETNIKRIEARRLKGNRKMEKENLEAKIKLFEAFEPIEEDEEKSANVIIEPEMTRENVVDEILNKIKIYL